jgi:hypothetical protein
MTQLDKVVFSRGPTATCPAHHGKSVPGRELMSASLVDRLRLMIFPLIAGTQGARRSSQTWRPPTLN